MHIRDIDAAARVRDLFYEAAVDSARWGQALDALTAFFNVWGVTLFVMDKELGRPSAGWLGGQWDPRGLELYVAHYGQLDPTWPIIGAQTPLGQVASCTNFIDDDFVRKNEFYQDFLIPHGGRYLTGGRLFEDAAEIVGMSVHSGKKRGPLRENEVACFQAIWPSLMTATQVSRRLVRADLDISISRLNGMLDAFERMTCAAVLLDSSGKILAMNRRAEQSLNGCVRVDKGRIVARDRDSDANLQRLIASTIKSVQGGYDNTAARIVRPTGKPLVAFVMPILGVQNYGLKTPSALVVFIDPNESQNTSDAILIAGYGLSRAEARVASIFGKGLSLGETADRIGIQYETARSHLKIIFHKMGIHRQAELAAILARIAMVGSSGNFTP